ncbi:MAG TPA: NfeD family protein [Casimicrobiaceae bacterium]|nr:NfeD family protein [Casimicrobiaceae bacterium]
MAAYWVWWALAGMLVIVELLTGTFYLMAAAVAFAVGGFAALLGVAFEIQLVVAAVVALIGLWAAHHWRTKHATPPPDQAFDIGQTVRVQAWNADGTARVAYRGSLWQAEPASPDVVRGETMVIVALRGSTLVIGDRKP